MPRDALIALSGRAWMGSLVRSGVAVAFPSVALLDDRQPALGILLYLVEIILTALMLLARTAVATLLVSRDARQESADEPDVLALRKTRDLATTTVAVGLLGLPFLLVAVLLAHPELDWPVLRDSVLDWGRWVAVLIVASALLDTLVAPVRTPEWLHTSVTMQMTRTLLLHPVILFGFLLFGLTGSLTGMVVVFVAVRVVLDLSTMFRGLPDWARRPGLPRTGRVE